MKKTFILLSFVFYASVAVASDVVIPLFGEENTSAPKTEDANSNKNFPLFLPPTAPLETVKDLPFKEPINTSKTTPFSTPIVSVEKTEEKKPSQTIVQPKVTPAPEPVLTKTEQPQTTEKTKNKENTKAKTIRFKEGEKSDEKAKQQPALKQTIEKAVEKAPQKPVLKGKKDPKQQLEKTKTVPTAPSSSLLQKSMELPVAEEKEDLNPLNVEDEVLLGDELPMEVIQATKKVPIDEMDIMGGRLYMSPQDMTDEAQERGFRVSGISHAIPTFATTRLEKACRAEENLVQLERVQNCVRERAQKEGIYYISELVLDNAATKEQIKGRFTSLFTDNKAYYIEYTAYGDNSLGTSIKDIAKKTTRRDLFWDLVFEKYGEPTYPEQLVWGDPRESYFKAYMEGSALNGKLIMEDKKLPSDDMSEAYEQLPPPPEINFFSFVK